MWKHQVHSETSAEQTMTVGNFTAGVWTRLIFSQLPMYYDRINHNSDKIHTCGVKLWGSFRSFNTRNNSCRKFSHLGCERVWLLYNFWCAMIKLSQLWKVYTREVKVDMYWIKDGKCLRRTVYVSTSLLIFNWRVKGGYRDGKTLSRIFLSLNFVYKYILTFIYPKLTN